MSTALAIALLVGGLFFVLVSSLGVLRLPDFYTRCHALGKSDTLGSILVLGGLAVHEGLTLTSFKMLLILAFVALGNPTATHALTRAALRTGLEMWSRTAPEKESKTP
ncbi:MAG: monovalent cation/H(+) antiporter subunit G [Dehalococcoidia bacterium]|nr:monovalent cation/H(+) antiporter subunit G [Dehalococcoidia bacterium]MDW8119790.1 monovalent cation/H(+) antiporter subunit G [Chloroflexota bacterium]